MLDSARLSSLTRDVSLRVHFRLRGGMLRFPRDAPSQWTCDFCGVTRYWAARSTCYRCGEARGHTEERERGRRRHFRNVARAAREGGGTAGSSPAAAPTACSVCAAARKFDHAPRGAQPRAQRPPAEADPYDSEQTALLRAALALFQNCHLSNSFLEEIRKCGPASKGQPNFSREQEMLNLKKKVHREE